MARDGARLPGQRHPGFGRLVILGEPGCAAAPGVHRPGGGALPPGLAQRLGHGRQGLPWAAVPGGRPWRTRCAAAATPPESLPHHADAGRAPAAGHRAQTPPAGEVRRWPRHGQRPSRPRAWLCVRPTWVRAARERRQQRQAVRARRGGRSPWPRALGLGGRAIARDDLAPGMLPEPLGQGLGRALQQARARGAPRLLTQRGAYVWRGRRAQSSTPRPIGGGRDGTGSLRSRRRRVGRLPPDPMGGRGASRLCPPSAAEGAEARGEPQRAPGWGTADTVPWPGSSARAR
jgi:hypothetical protein